MAMWERRMEQEGFAPTMEAVRNGAQSLAGRAIAGPPPTIRSRRWSNAAGGVWRIHMTIWKSSFRIAPMSPAKAFRWPTSPPA